jgi:glutamate dehydrogenase
VRVLGDVRAAVEDWPAMTDKALALADELAAGAIPVDAVEANEVRDLLLWLRDGNFTFLATATTRSSTRTATTCCAPSPAPGSGSSATRAARRVGELREAAASVRRLARRKNLVTLTKANSRATVHRPSYLDYIGVKRFGPDGEVCGECRFLGLYTHHAYAANPWEIPVVRRKAQGVVERSGLPKGSHDHKALVEIVETYPRDELFPISEDDLFETALGILHLGERRRVRLFVRRDPFDRFLSCLVYLPARPVQHGQPPACAGDPRGRVRRAHRGLRDARLRVGAGAACTSSSTPSRCDPGVRRRRDRGAPRRGDARLDRRPP